jgi:hypothetical protein
MSPQAAYFPAGAGVGTLGASMQSAVNGDQRFCDRRAPARQCNYRTSRLAKTDVLIAKRVVADYLP